ncbi:hypothetical protein [Craterilacuibacter sp. RT1T]|uniref:hypothetical protein n=1 Tax=Craterilacuibacter sp. RT1T TaxID=2942211 RepID=UPI0020BDA444|nr:hypothetical protein [Craterilacuibacter sp. RT1T]MCL6262642.1 hypothetical protein [Craterilacuibacter sp. RT1T]
MTAMVDAPSNSRWWESYLVRYLFGSVVGIGCVLLFLNKSTGFDLVGLSSALNGWHVLLVAILGFAFCYFASMPIAVMHYGRFKKSRIEEFVRYFWLGLSFSLVVGFFCGEFIEKNVYLVRVFSLLVSTFIALLFMIRPAGDSEFCLVDCLVWSVGSFLFSILLITFQYNYALMLPAVVVGMLQYCVLFKIWMEEDGVYTFYRSLSRARGSSGAHDIRDTYSHLREHSNAIFIVIIEISLFVLLFNLIIYLDVDWNKNKKFVATRELLEVVAGFSFFG